MSTDTGVDVRWRLDLRSRNADWILGDAMTTERVALGNIAVGRAEEKLDLYRLLVHGIELYQIKKHFANNENKKQT